MHSVSVSPWYLQVLAAVEAGQLPRILQHRLLLNAEVRTLLLTHTHTHTHTVVRNLVRVCGPCHQYISTAGCQQIDMRRHTHTQVIEFDTQPADNPTTDATVAVSPVPLQPVLWYR